MLLRRRYFPLLKLKERKGVHNEYDFEELLYNLLGEGISNGILDLNSDLTINIFDLLLLSDFIQDR